MKKTIQVGTSDFKELIEGNHYFVDKSLLIKEFIEDVAKVILTPRPRRFGKTLNMSMLKYFFDIETREETKDLFKGLKIEDEKDIMKMQGEYPVIFVSFKNQKYDTYDGASQGIALLLANLYNEHRYLLDSDKLSEEDKEKFKNILKESGSEADKAEGISTLMRFMSSHYEKKVILFIDEYDIPIQQAYVKGYYDELICFMQIMLTAALKDNNNLEKALVTGILRVAKESIFSGLNNVQVHTMFSYKFNDKFGFTENEVSEILNYYNMSCDLQEVKNWYNGYIFGGKVIYNPWSVLNYVSNNENGFMPYWINSSGNELIKMLLRKGNKQTKENLEELIKGNSIKKIVDDHIVMKEVEEDDENLWSFLCLSGYLKPVKTELIRGRLHCELKIPNEEVQMFYDDLIKKWFKESLNSDLYNTMLKALITRDIETFDEIFSDFVMDSMSYFDVSGKEPEKVYHAFVLGMIVSLAEEYEVKSNKESGYGRYDVMLIPKDTSKLGIIIEFKRIRNTATKTIDAGTREALEQIENNKYESELRKKNICDILKLAIVFKGKEVKVTEG
ncbi:AAA family ATPase [uncultured Clostridium sp.]|uniref:AAA family ATPase n=1 Tax=uncultured Clostridium sp. TaxID=59620 RepID=UPI0025F075BC|nr:AAA family ATPase [uncultured Clostridium sp.]